MFYCMKRNLPEASGLAVDTFLPFVPSRQRDVTGNKENGILRFAMTQGICCVVSGHTSRTSLLPIVLSRQRNFTAGAKVEQTTRTEH